MTSAFPQANMSALTPARLINNIFNTRIAPLSLAGSWDNVGLLLEAPNSKPSAKKILLTIDLTAAVAREALALEGCSVVVAYHPAIFSGLKSLTLGNSLQSSLLQLAASGISVFSPHTSLDAIPGGMNDHLASAFAPFTSSVPCEPIKDAPEGFEGSGVGRRIELAGEGMDLDEIIRRVKKITGLAHVQLAEANEKPAKIKSIAMCVGSGGSVLSKVKADVWLTGELSHHEILATVAKNTSVILTGHTSCERPYLAGALKAKLEQELEKEDGGGWEVIVSKEDREPWRVV